MGSVRKLATVVVIALIAVATAVTVYTANEPNRRENETNEQQGVQIERGTSLYMTYCLQCHGPAGLGSAEKGPDGTGSMGRPGAILNQSIYPAETLATLPVVFQSDDPVQQGIAEDWLRFRIMYGIPSEAQVKQDPEAKVLMPSFRHDLGVEQMNDLIFLIMHGDWNYVYNTAIHQTGLQVCEQTPEAERTGMCEGDMHDAVAYPTAPPPTASPDDDATPTATEAPSADGTDHAVTAVDTAFDTNAITVKPGDTITLTNNGFLQHDLYVDGLGIETDLLDGGGSQTITIPADAAPGDYEFWCTVTGHKESGMQGTITVVAP